MIEYYTLCRCIKFLWRDLSCLFSSTLSQAVREHRQQRNHPSPWRPSPMEPGPLRLPLAPLLWAHPLLLLPEYHGKPRDHPGALMKAVITGNWVKAPGVHQVSLRILFLKLFSLLVFKYVLIQTVLVMMSRFSFFHINIFWTRGDGMLFKFWSISALSQAVTRSCPTELSVLLV